MNNYEQERISRHIKIFRNAYPMLLYTKTGYTTLKKFSPVRSAKSPQKWGDFCFLGMVWKRWVARRLEKGFSHTVKSNDYREFAKHETVAEGLGIAYHFANPYHGWGRDSNENSNRLVRAVFPQKARLLQNHWWRGTGGSGQTQQPGTKKVGVGFT